VKFGNFSSKVRHSFLISKFEPVWIIQEYIKTVGAHLSAARSEPRANRVQTAPTPSDSSRHRLARAHDSAPTTSPPTPFAAHQFRRPQPPPRAAIRGAPHRQAPPFQPQSSAHAPTLFFPRAMPTPTAATSSASPSYGAHSSGEDLPVPTPQMVFKEYGRT
jgi:hypothetical protein